MPFVEILAPPAEPAAKLEASRALTDAIVQGFGVGPETVSLYFLTAGPADYAHGGGPVAAGTPQRVFVKVHAYRRDADQRRAVAISAAPAVAQAYGIAPDDVAIYFLDRAPDEVAHGASLASD